MITLKKSALLVVIVSLGPAAKAVTFDYRFYNNSGCDHASPSQDIFPLAGRGAQDQCLSAPPINNWNAIELDNPINTGGLVLITFCDMNCQGARSSEQNNSNCFHPAPNCFIGSFSVNETTSGVGNSSSSQSSSSLFTQSSNTSTSNPSTVTVTQISFDVGSSSSTPSQSSGTPKSKISTGTIIGGVIGGVLLIAGFVFIPFFLLRQPRKRQLVSPFYIPELVAPFRPSPAPTTFDEVQMTGESVGADHTTGAPVFVSSYGEHISPL
ncbi:hypothetical protein GALMADRAFT_138713 [Galerina marginata CBS 339.88]|uniref:Mid2 domain-containing protein n=1 Tax=Galerina marginata (strain CBS 339.88) TaxID=685588 RepID=A0A067T3C1_GALM3|nr:hypothetical protein GALMADRAFT_138713 [Galerina marginata CBS 339.88]